MSNVKRCAHAETVITAKQATAIAKVLRIDAEQIANLTLIPEKDSND